jgi:hypothetical protein
MKPLLPMIRVLTFFFPLQKNSDSRIHKLALSWCFFGCFVAATIHLASLPSAAAPTINEIHFRPGIGYPENPALEFIEIHNPDPEAVDVSGWAFTRGISITLPAGASISAGGFLVVAASPALLQAAHPSLSQVYGPWSEDTKLANSGETLTLVKPGTVPPSPISLSSTTAPPRPWILAT